MSQNPKNKLTKAMKKITNNKELHELVSKMDYSDEYFAIRIAGCLMLFNSKHYFNNKLKKFKNSCHGIFNNRNFFYYRF